MFSADIIPFRKLTSNVYSRLSSIHEPVVLPLSVKAEPRKSGRPAKYPSRQLVGRVHCTPIDLSDDELLALMFPEEDSVLLVG